nr:MAG TPA: hypothetical protein [Caudoviricetes sp.]
MFRSPKVKRSHEPLQLFELILVELNLYSNGRLSVLPLYPSSQVDELSFITLLIIRYVK